MTSTIKSQLGTTMFNLQNKRSLPRQVIKWMQGLDLSYSIKDYRKDLNNGFLIGEIISRYQPGKIPMHAFENSQNNSRRDNNWKQLKLFFSKYTLKEVNIDETQYDKVMNNTDNKYEQLYQFICRLYSVCTKRSIPQSAPNVDLPSTKTNNPNLTASYLLKEDGLQKLNNSNIGNQQSSVSQNNSVVEQDVRVPTRKISPNVEMQGQIDGKNVGIWGQGHKITSKKKSWNFEGKDQSHYSEDNVDTQKMVFDYLNQILDQCINSSQKFEGQKSLLFDSESYRPTEMLKNSIGNLDSQLVCSFLSQIINSVNYLVPIMLREINEIWKFFIYFIKLLRSFQDNTQQLSLLCEILSNYAKAIHQSQSKRLIKIFNDSLLQTIIGEAKSCVNWRKRNRIMNLVYEFSGRQINQKKTILFKLKEQLGSNNSLYLQWLSILIRQQKQSVGLLEDYLYYAYQNLHSSSLNIRSSALKILLFISQTNISLIESRFVGQIQIMTKSNQPQHLYLIFKIYYNILKSIMSSNSYNILIKGTTNTNLIKVYNPDHQKQQQELKNRISTIYSAIDKFYRKTQNSILRQIIAKVMADFIGENQIVMKILLEEMSHQRAEKFLKQQKFYFQFKTIQGQINPVNLSLFIENSNEILTNLIGMIFEGEKNIEEYIFLINYCLTHINIKKVNMQIWEDISSNIIRPYAALFSNELRCESARIGIQNALIIYFNYDMKIRQLNQWLAESICKILTQKKTQCTQSVSKFNQWLNQLYRKDKNELIRFTIEQISSIMESKGFKGIIKIQ